MAGGVQGRMREFSRLELPPFKNMFFKLDRHACTYRPNAANSDIAQLSRSLAVSVAEGN